MKSLVLIPLSLLLLAGQNQSSISSFRPPPHPAPPPIAAPLPMPAQGPDCYPSSASQDTSYCVVVSSITRTMRFTADFHWTDGVDSPYANVWITRYDLSALRPESPVNCERRVEWVNNDRKFTMDCGPFLLTAGRPYKIVAEETNHNARSGPITLSRAKD